MTSVTSSHECEGLTVSFPRLLRYSLALVLLSIATKFTGEPETKVFMIVSEEPFFTSIPFGAWLSPEKSRAFCPKIGRAHV